MHKVEEMLKEHINAGKKHKQKLVNMNGIIDSLQKQITRKK